VASASVSSDAQARLAPLNPLVNIHLLYDGTVYQNATYTAIERGYFKDEGLAVDANLVPSFAAELPTLASGQTDVGWLPAGDPGFFNALGRGVKMHLTACFTYTNSSGFSQNGAGFVVRQDLIDSGKYKGPADLKGLNIGLFGPSANLGDYYLEKWLATGQLTLKDFNRVSLTPPDVVAALANKKVDAAFAASPFIQIIQNQHTATLVQKVADIADGVCAMELVFSDNFATNQPEAARRFMAAWLRGARDLYLPLYKSQGSMDDVLKTLTHFTAVKDPAQYQSLVAAKAIGDYDPNGGPLSSWPQRAADYQDFFVRMGLQKQKVDVANVIDQSFLNYALQRLGRLS